MNIKQLVLKEKRLTKKQFALILATIMTISVAGCQKADKTVGDTSSITTEITKERITTTYDNETVDVSSLSNVSGIDNAYALPDGVCDKNEQPSMVRFLDNKLLLIITVGTVDNSVKAKVFSMTQGKVIATTELESNGYEEPEFLFELSDKDIIYFAYPSGKIATYTKELKPIEEISAVKENWNPQYCHYNDSFYYSVGKKVMRYSMSDRKTSEVADIGDGYQEMYSVGIIEKTKELLVKAYSDDADTAYVYISLEDGSIHEDRDSVSNTSIFGDHIIYSNQGSNVIKIADAQDNRYYTTFALDSAGEVNNMIMDDAGRFIITSEYTVDSNDDGNEIKGSYTIRLYNIIEKKLESKVEFPVSDKYYLIRSMETAFGKYASMSVNDTKGNTNIYLYDLDNLKDSSTSLNSDVDYFTTGVTKYTNNRLAEKIEKKYGVSIKLRNDAVRFFPDFAITPTSDEQLINNALTTLDSVFSLLPSGMIKELNYEGSKGLEIYLTGTLVQGDVNGTSTPGAFSLEYDSTKMIVLDASQTENLRKNIAHEMNHSIEDKIQYLIGAGKIDDYTLEWNELNPKKFTYYYSYVTDEGIDVDSTSTPEFTSDDTEITDVNKVYFVDGYSKSFPSEDRSRIFENLLGTNPDESLPNCFKSKHIKAKVAVMTNVLKKAFKSVKNADSIYWERWYK